MCLMRKSLAHEEFKECPIPDGESRKNFKQSCAVIYLTYATGLMAEWNMSSSGKKPGVGKPFGIIVQARQYKARNSGIREGEERTDSGTTSEMVELLLQQAFVNTQTLEARGSGRWLCDSWWGKLSRE